MIGKAIYNILSNDATLTGLVGTNIFPQIAPQDTNAPFVVYVTSNTIPSQHKDGAAPNDQVDTYAKTHSSAVNISEQIRTLLEDYEGTANGINIKTSWLDNQQDGDFVADLHFYGISQTYVFRAER